jgi:hypothetical protein
MQEPVRSNAYGAATAQVRMLQEQSVTQEINKTGFERAAGNCAQSKPGKGGREMQHPTTITKGWPSARRLALYLLATLFSVMAATAASAGNLTNTAKAFGTAPSGAAGAVQSATSTVNVPVAAKTPKYSVVKSVTSTTTTSGTSATLVDGGDTITYSYVVTNTGNVSLNTVTLTDPGVSFAGGAAVPLTTGPTKVSGDATNPGVLDVGEVWTYTATYVLTQANVNTAAGVANGVSNTAASSARDPQNVAIAPTASTLTATTTINSTPSLTIAKTSNLAGPLVAGNVVTFSYLVTNNGNVTITGVGITETAFNGTGGTGALTPTGGATTLAPGATTTFTASYTVTQNDVDTLQP